MVGTTRGITCVGVALRVPNEIHGSKVRQGETGHGGLGLAQAVPIKNAMV